MKVIVSKVLEDRFNEFVVTDSSQELQLLLYRVVSKVILMPVFLLEI